MSQNGPEWERKGDRNGCQKGRDHETLIIEKTLVYLSKFIVFESRGGGTSRPRGNQNRSKTVLEQKTNKN